MSAAKSGGLSSRICFAHAGYGVAQVSAPVFIFNCQTAKRHHPYCLARPRVGLSPSLSSLPSAKLRGMARQVAQPLFFLCPCSLSRTRGASRRAITASSFRHRAALFAGRLSRPALLRIGFATVSGGLTDAASGAPDGHPSAKLLAGGPYWPPSGAPAPPGCVLCGKHARGRRIRSHPHDAS